MKLEDFAAGLERSKQHRHHHGHHHDDACPTVLKYINNLYCIELLRVIKITDVDETIAWQYAVEYNEPWADKPNLVQQFKAQHAPILWQYINQRCMALINKLMCCADDLCTEIYVGTPLEPRVIDSILSTLDHLQEDNFEQRLCNIHQVTTLSSNGVMPPPLAGGDDNFGEFMVADQILQGVFNNFTGSTTTSLNTDEFKDRYGRHRVQVLDEKLPLCIKALKRWYKLQCERLQDLNSSQYKCVLFNNMDVWAHIFSILFRLVTPHELHPNSLDRYYDKYIRRHGLASKAIGYARKFSLMTPLDVVGDSFPPLCPCDASHKPLNVHRYASGTIDADNLVERYLVTQYLAEHARNDIADWNFV